MQRTLGRDTASSNSEGSRRMRSSFRFAVLLAAIVALSGGGCGGGSSAVGTAQGQTTQSEDVVTLPNATQTIAQPANTNLNVNRFERLRFADQYPGSDIGAQVNSAIADLGSAGGVVEIPAGSYAFSTTITINQPYTWVRCQGWATILTYTGSGTAVMMGDSTTPGSNPATISAVRFSNCTLRGPGTGIGIYMQGGLKEGNYIDRVNFDSTGLGFQTFIMHSDLSGGMTYDNYIQNNRILLNNGQSSTYSGIGIDVSNKSHNLIISNNIIHRKLPDGVTTGSDNSICLRIADSTNVKVVDNDIEGCGAALIQLGLTAFESRPTNTTIIRGNYFEPLDAATINVDVGKYTTGTLIEGNFMNGDSLQNYMIQVEDCSYGTVIQNNTHLGVVSAVINNLTNSCTQALTIAGNTVSGSTAPYLQGTKGIVYWQDPNLQTVTLGSTTYANLPPVASKPNGTQLYCSDCTIAAACAAGGTGAIAKSINGAWVCN